MDFFQRSKVGNPLQRNNKEPDVVLAYKQQSSIFIELLVLVVCGMISSSPKLSHVIAHLCNLFWAFSYLV